MSDYRIQHSSPQRKMKKSPKRAMIYSSWLDVAAASAEVKTFLGSRSLRAMLRIQEGTTEL